VHDEVEQFIFGIWDLLLRLEGRSKSPTRIAPRDEKFAHAFVRKQRAAASTRARKSPSEQNQFDREAGPHRNHDAVVARPRLAGVNDVLEHEEHRG
jgi:hypothetical protein